MAFHPAIDQVIQYINTIYRSGSLLMYMIIISSNIENRVDIPATNDYFDF